MTIKFHCSHCGSKLEADEDVVGIEVECPHCDKAIRVPTPEANDAEDEEALFDDDIDVFIDDDLDMMLEAEEAEAAMKLPDANDSDEAIVAPFPTPMSPQGLRIPDLTEESDEISPRPPRPTPTAWPIEDSETDTQKMAVARPLGKEAIPTAEPLADDQISPEDVLAPEAQATPVENVVEAQIIDDDADPNPYRAGTKVGNFEIGYLLGAGSMGQVFLAKQISMDRQVALKILPPEIMSRDSEAAKQFMNEVRVLAKLEHPNIVTAFEAGEDNGIYYLAMSYVNGESLESRLQRERHMPEEEALAVMIKVAQALSHAWDRFKLLHQDVKPANIMIEQSGEVKLMDMGIAKISTDEEGTATFVMGTPYYMSPEQATGRLDLDFRSDQYSLGSTLYHLLTGHYPFIGDDPSEVMKKHFSEPLTPPKTINPDISEATNKLIKRMMAKAPDRRFQSWDELIKNMQEIMRAAVQERKRRASTKNRTVAPRPKKMRGSRAAKSAAYRSIKAGPSMANLIGVFVGILVIFYLVLSMVNKSGVLHNYGMSFPQKMFLPPFRRATPGVHYTRPTHIPSRHQPRY